ncbi:MAG: TonB-dependent receptor plug domain-containing protein [Muribaculaceae bacterium]|nr:TonB-dependent receptor plug domain-containing protein [Muribaculaceae bacterium]
MKLSVLLFSAIIGAAGAMADVPFNGIITGIDGKPIHKARIYVSNPKMYALSDKQGRFGLTDVKPTDTLHIRIKKEEYAVPVDGHTGVRLIMLTDNGFSAEQDNDLVDQGYGFVRRREHTGVSNGISGDRLRATGRRTILAALEGMVPGLNISGGDSYGSTSVNIRGERSIMLSSNPLYLVDGIVVQTLDGISLNDVDYVEVMKDGGIYGSRGANGVISVHLKH